MLYMFRDKIYVKPFDNKIVEVSITKKNNEYDVKAEKSPLELTSKELKELVSITLENAYKYLHKENRNIMLEK